eukprot:TRINITY_DN15499_c0_g1_i1.p1 TRINITY_DN15499_c0_g1~~TRINITY_DN15499_c0_g1_i1.p1  ORF type:complete len:297 (-),score=98.61 TRINITY_DN15499_c0_g1_i1:59-949(-)
MAGKLSYETNGVSMAFGTGTKWYKGDNDKELDQAVVLSVKQALDAGFVHLDCAEMYGTEKEVGEAIRQYLAETHKKREDIFVTTKVWPGIANIPEAMRGSLERLGLDYVDLYLIHAPFFELKGYHGTIPEAWRAMESLVEAGMTKSIGVSNFRISDLEELLVFAKIKPAVNQIEHHPYLQQPDLWNFCKKNEIIIECYSPLATINLKPGGPVDDVVSEIAKAHNKTPTQVLLQWTLQKGNVAITTSSKRERLDEALAVLKEPFKLTDDEIKRINDEGAKLKFRKYWAPQFAKEDQQ